MTAPRLCDYCGETVTFPSAAVKFNGDLKQFCYSRGRNCYGKLFTIQLIPGQVLLVSTVGGEQWKSLQPVQSGPVRMIALDEFMDAISWAFDEGGNE